MRRSGTGRDQEEGEKSERKRAWKISLSLSDEIDCRTRSNLFIPHPLLCGLETSLLARLSIQRSVVQREFSTMAPTTRRRGGNGGAHAAAAADGDNAASKQLRQRQRRSSSSAATTTTPTTTTPTSPTTLTAAEAADARELEEMGGIDPATSFLYTPRTLTGLGIGKEERERKKFCFLSFFLSLFLALFSVLPSLFLTPSLSLSLSKNPNIKISTGIALLIFYTGALSAYTGGGGSGGTELGESSAEDSATGGRRGLAAALCTWLLYCLLQGSPRMPLLRPHPAVWRLVHGEDWGGEGRGGEETATARERGEEKTHVFFSKTFQKKKKKQEPRSRTS